MPASIPALIIQFLALAIQYGPEFGIDIKEAWERLQNGESAEDLIKELDEKRDDLPDLDFGKSTSAITRERMAAGDNQDL